MSHRDWYAARILLEAVHPDDDDPGDKLFEDKIVLVNAASENKAKAKAKKFGKAAEQEYLNGEGKRVCWTFRGVLDLVSLFDAPGDGSEVYYGFLGEDDVSALRRSLEPGHLGRD